MINYQNAKIYKIVCNNTGKQYIGSTVQNRLSSRLATHKNKKIGSSKEIIEGGNYSIILIENYPCNSKDELHKRERHYIETMECINHNIPSRTKEEYREVNREKINNQQKDYYKNERKKIVSQPITCECGAIVKKFCFNRHLKSKKHLDYLGNN